MSAPIAALGHIGIRKEESFASGGDVTAYQPIISEDIQPMKAYNYSDRIMNTAQQVGGRIMNHAANGSVVFPISPGNSQVWWECGIGQSSTPYYPSRPLSSMVIEVDRETAALYTSGDMIASLELSSAQSGELQCTASIEGKGFQDKAASSSSYTSGDDPYNHNEATFELDDVECLDITSFNVTVNNNLISDLYANQKERRDIPATKCQVTGSFTKIFQDTTARNKFLQESPTKIEATWARGSNSFKITLIKVKFDSRPAPLAGQTEYIAETFNFTAYVDDPSSEYAIQIDVV